MKITAILTQRAITSNTQEAHNYLSTRHFGEKTGEKILYSPYEAAYLTTLGMMTITDLKGKVLTPETLERFCMKYDQQFSTHYAVFKDLRKKGHIVKSGQKFGSVFRVYEKGTRPGKEHATWLVLPVPSTHKLSLQEFAAKNRIAHSTKKKILLAVVDEEESPTYYETTWKKLS